MKSSIKSMMEPQCWCWTHLMHLSRCAHQIRGEVTSRRIEPTWKVYGLELPIGVSAPSLFRVWTTRLEPLDTHMQANLSLLHFRRQLLLARTEASAWESAKWPDFLDRSDYRSNPQVWSTLDLPAYSEGRSSPNFAFLGSEIEFLGNPAAQTVVSNHYEIFF